MAIEITLLEIDAPNAVFNAPLSGRGGSTTRESNQAEDRDASDDGPSTHHRSGSRVVPILALVGLLAIAVVVRLLRDESVAAD